MTAPDDPQTWIGLIFRILDDPRRTLCAVVLSICPACVVAQSIATQPILDSPIMRTGLAGSISTAAALTWFRRRRAGQKPDGPAGHPDIALNRGLEATNRSATELGVIESNP